MLPFLKPPSLARFEVQRDLALLVVLVAACAGPFLSQPFHMDDNFYLDMARNAQAKPLHPNDTPYVFEGRALADMGSHSHPPLQTWFLALVRWRAGEGPGTEWIYHAATLLFPLLAVVSFYFIAARYVERPIWPALGLAVAPLAQVMQHTLMTDVPMLAFWLVAIASFIWATELERSALYAGAAVALSAAVLTSYQSLAVILLLGFYRLCRGRGRAAFIALAAPVAVLAAWFSLGYAHYHRFLLTDTLGFVGSREPWAWRSLVTKLAALLEYQAWLLLFPPFLLYVVARGLRGRLLALGTLAAVYAAAAAVPRYSFAETGIFVIGLVTGAFLAARIAELGVAGLRARSAALGFAELEARFLVLWYFGVAAYCVVLLTEGSARYILPLAPPVLLYFFRRLEVLEATEYRARPLVGSAMVASGALVISLFWGGALAHADREFARVYPKAARDAARLLPALPSYFAGEWGFRYYFREAGFAQLPVDETQVAGGSIVATPALAIPYELPQGLRSMLMPLAPPLIYQPSTPLRLLDKGSNAGFYSTGWGLLPFSLSNRPLETIELRQVNFMVERLPWAAVESPAAGAPWPGYFPLAGLSPLAVLVYPGSRLSYPWSAEHPVILEVNCGVAAGGYVEGDPTMLEFEVRQCDAAGAVLERRSVRLQPGLRPDQRGWQPIALRVEGGPRRGGTLEFLYAGADGRAAIGAFASSYLRRVP